MHPSEQAVATVKSRPVDSDGADGGYSDVYQRGWPAQPTTPATPWEVYCGGWRGTALAGGCYPIVALAIVFMLQICIGDLPNILPATLDHLAAFAVIMAVGGFYSFFIGWITAGACYLPCLALVWSAAKLCGASRQVVWVSAAAGGATGTLCASALPLADEPNKTFDIALTYLLFAAAIVMGQVGAWRHAEQEFQRGILNDHEPTRAFPTLNLRFNLRQLIGATTIAAIASAGVAALRPQGHGYAILVFGLFVNTLSLVALLRYTSHADALMVLPDREVNKATLDPGLSSPN